MFSIEQEIKEMKKAEAESEKSFSTERILKIFDGLSSFIKEAAKKIKLPKDQNNDYLIGDVVMTHDSFKIDDFRLTISGGKLDIEKKEEKMIGNQRNLMKNLIGILEKNVDVFYEKMKDEINKRERDLLDSIRNF